MTYVHNSFWCFFEKVHILFFQLLNFSGTFHKIFKKRELNMFVSSSVLIFQLFFNESFIIWILLSANQWFCTGFNQSYFHDRFNGFSPWPDFHLWHLTMSILMFKENIWFWFDSFFTCHPISTTAAYSNNSLLP